jgi:hypothetical protein
VCRTHGTELTKTYLTKTLTQGWWGIISFFVNWFAVANDVVMLRRVSRLAPPAPVPAPASVDEPVAGSAG